MAGLLVAAVGQGTALHLPRRLAGKSSIGTRGSAVALVIRGRLVPMASDPAVGSDPEARFRGRLWIGDDGLIKAVTKGTKAGPPGFEAAPVVDVGSSLVFPGLIDLHNHLAYNTLPLWVEPAQQAPFRHHNDWTDAATYAAKVTWPAAAFVAAAPEELLAYVEAKAIAGGVTTIQGSPPKNRPRDGWLVRNAEDETWGTGNRNLVYASALTLPPATLADRANRMRNDGASFIYHCAEGQAGSVVAKEFHAATLAGCLQERFVAVHCNAVGREAFQVWGANAGAVAWSPFSNLWLYGTTTDVPAAIDEGLTVCLGSDWGPSGTRNVLGELKAARVVADHLGWALSDADLVRMVTANPGDVLARAWPQRIGRLQPGAVGDVTVVRAAAGADPFAALVAATERDVELVVIGGRPRYGRPPLLQAAGAQAPTTVEVAGERRALALDRPDDPTATWPWEEVVARLEQVREDPKREIEAARALLAEWAGRLDRPEAPLRLALDMPTGLGPVAGLPKDLGQIVVPELDGLAHDDGFVDALPNQGFHGGVLNRLADFYA
jgi:5-methylthioadenosine/S-adenosylhomocysteine deaminase